MWVSREKWKALHLRIFELERKVSEIEKTQTDIPEWAEKCIDEYMANCQIGNHQ